MRAPAQAQMDKRAAFYLRRERNDSSPYLQSADCTGVDETV
ncbi:Hypothetical protein ABZS17G119_01985 [Kosakonia cowanii]